MSVLRRVAHLSAFLLAGTGAFFLLVWLYVRWNWLSLLTSSGPFVVALLIGAGIGFLSWVGFEIGRRRWRRARASSGTGLRGGALRGFALSLLWLLVLGILAGLVVTVPKAAGPGLGSGHGISLALLTVVFYVLFAGVAAVIPTTTGLLTGAQTEPGAARALLGGMSLGVCGGVAFALPLVLLILLVPGPVPSCAQARPPRCGFLYFTPAFYAEALGTVAVLLALTVGVASGIATGLGVLAARLIDRRADEV